MREEAGATLTHPALRAGSPLSRIAGEGAERSEAGEGASRHEQLVLELDGYEGPIDLLLSLAREQKVDLGKISILALADQYLAFIATQRSLNLEIAADYLVMAAWLAYLKSRLLLPQPPQDDEPSATELAAQLEHRLRLLEAMQNAGVRLMGRPRIGHDVFLRGVPEGLPVTAVPVYELQLYELLRAYGEGRRRTEAAVLAIEPAEFYSMDDALSRLARFIGHVPNWRELASFLPRELRGEVFRRSALAATFAATLELARRGRIELRQDRAFGPIYLRSPAPAAAHDMGAGG
ncbi:MAG TPA: ScpA family protein [Stellaceae bacterium]|nr:ScpA family protein [Stellaceae bacterium]